MSLVFQNWCALALTGVLSVTCFADMAFASDRDWISETGTQSTLNTPEEPKSDFFKRLKLQTDFSSVGFNYDEGQDESQVVLFSMRPRARLEFSDSAGFLLDAGLNLSSSRDQTRFQNPDQQLLNLREAAGYVQAGEAFKLKLGAISQDHFDNDMLIARRGFPGLYVSTGFKSKRLMIRPKFQYAIPTSSSFEADRNEEEKVPGLRTYGLEAAVKPVKWLLMTANLNQFTFFNLPSIVAFRSNRLGNSVIGTDPSESLFRYQFEGTSYTGGMTLRYHKHVTQNLKAMVIENLEAPGDRRRSQSAYTSLTFDFRNFSITPKYERFFAESDSVPAFYSAFEYGGANRDGEMVGLDLHFKKLGVKVKAQYVQAREIEDLPLQNDVNIYSMHLEFSDDIL